MKSLSILLAAALSTTALAAPALENRANICGTCNPLSGENQCDITTSCINTGTRFHCACRAGYKASRRNLDVTQQFRLNVPDYSFLVFTPENTVCDTLCRNHNGFSDELCAEVPIYDQCRV